jgi:hypothetical protein
MGLKIIQGYMKCHFNNNSYYNSIIISILYVMVYNMD